ncbi:phage tail protein [Yersinia kristensenii]|uniref:phage tail protein n=1 Tax=Yersinia kristensenii TaxID=28152 RepID=UPI0022FE6ED8|nr:phage tail protein [Yersinia kristensenii]MDA5487860.1 phage tail protein [Yersinia kristensenii]
MTTKFFAVLTNLGAARLANATALGTRLEITHMAVGDGGGVLPIPNAAQTQLIGEKRRASLNSLSVDAANSNQIIAEQVIPENEGGWWIREIGLFDKDGVLIAIANCPETYKPQLQEGSGRTQTVRVVLIVSSTEAVTLKIDPSVVLATRKYVDDQVIIVKAYADGLMAAHLAAVDSHSQYAPLASPALTGKPTAPTAAKADNSTQLATTAHVKQVSTDYAPLANPALTGTPTAPTAAVGTNTLQLANTAFVRAAIAALVASSPAALDTLKELADALGNDPNFAATMTIALAAKMDKAKNGSDIQNVAQFLANIGLGDATAPGKTMVIVNRGRNANGYWKIYNNGTIEMHGFTSPRTDGTADVILPIPLPAPVQIDNVFLTSHFKTNAPATLRGVLVNDSTATTTTTSFAVIAMNGSGVDNGGHGFSWRLIYEVL